MDLKMQDIVDLLNVPEKTVHQWIKENRIPAYKVKNQYYFNKAEINEWILKNNIKVSRKILDLKLTQKPVLISDLIQKGGIHYDIKGKTVRDVIKKVVDVIAIPPETTKQVILTSLLEREEMMTTAVGHGIAIPHPRNPIIADVDNESISLCLLEHEVDFKALDGKPVNTLFVIISSNAKRHLEILSKISYLCQQKNFSQLLTEKAPKDTILEFIDTIEKEWARGQ